MKLSVIIPSYKDPLLIKTIESILSGSELGDQIEVLAVLDGYQPTFALLEDPRVRYIHLGKNRGMRGAINAGMALARGEFVARIDEHCAFAPGFDKAMTDACKPNWIMTARRYFLDPVKWEVMQEHGYVDYEKLVIQGEEGGVQKFTGQRWRNRDKLRKHKKIDETMAMQGSCWIMPRKWWNEVIGELDQERYGPLYFDSHEVVFKTWKAGGKLMLNKNTWFSHKHRSFPRTHNQGSPENKHKPEYWMHGVEDWRDYYENEVRPAWGI